MSNEEWVTLRIAAEAVTGKQVSAMTAARWATNGVRGVKLTFTWIGGRRYTTVALMKKFKDELAKKGT